MTATTAPRRTRPLEERFWSKVDKRGPDDCWLWTGALNGSMGYGTIQRGGRGEGQVRAHRLSWELAHGPIPEGLIIDHLCRTPRCVNPGHMELVTFRENIMRGDSMSAQFARSSTCGKGHPRKPEERGKRCGECNRIWWRERYRKQKEAAA